MQSVMRWFEYSLKHQYRIQLGTSPKSNHMFLGQVTSSLENVIRICYFGFACTLTSLVEEKLKKIMQIAIKWVFCICVHKFTDTTVAGSWSAHREFGRHAKSTQRKLELSCCETTAGGHGQQRDARPIYGKMFIENHIFIPSEQG